LKDGINNFNQPIEDMKTAKQFLQNKYPEMRGENWNITDIDDNWIAEQMELFANERANAVLQEAAEKARLRMFEDQKPTPYELEDFILSLQIKE